MSDLRETLITAGKSTDGTWYCRAIGFISEGFPSREAALAWAIEKASEELDRLWKIEEAANAFDVLLENVNVGPWGNEYDEHKFMAAWRELQEALGAQPRKRYATLGQILAEKAKLFEAPGQEDLNYLLHHAASRCFDLDAQGQLTPKRRRQRPQETPDAP